MFPRIRQEKDMYLESTWIIRFQNRVIDVKNDGRSFSCLVYVLDLYK